MDAMDDLECKAKFCIRKTELPLLAEALDIPETFVFHQGTTAPGIEGLCVFLRRVAYPCRYSDLIHHFGRPVPELSMIYNIVYNTHLQYTRTQNHTVEQHNSLSCEP